MSTLQGVSMNSPAYPSGFILSEIIEALDLSVTDAVRALGVARLALSAPLNERTHLSPQVAPRIEKAFAVPMDTPMRMQNNFDIAETPKREVEIKAASFVANARPVSPA